MRLSIHDLDLAAATTICAALKLREAFALPIHRLSSAIPARSQISRASHRPPVVLEQRWLIDNREAFCHLRQHAPAWSPPTTDNTFMHASCREARWFIKGEPQRNAVEHQRGFITTKKP